LILPVAERIRVLDPIKVRVWEDGFSQGWQIIVQPPVLLHVDIVVVVGRGDDAGGSVGAIGGIVGGDGRGSVGAIGGIVGGDGRGSVGAIGGIVGEDDGGVSVGAIGGIGEDDSGVSVGGDPGGRRGGDEKSLEKSLNLFFSSNTSSV
jgi:hypothetical protein